jgi:two-component system chemotaxis response regulator CheB
MKVLVVDDSNFYCQAVRKIVSEFPFVDAVEVAMSGQEALDKVRTWRPDAITLDLDLPDISGIRVLRELRTNKNPAAIVVLSGLTESGTSIALLASELGALDVLVKPRASSAGVATGDLTQRLRIILRAVASNMVHVPRTGATVSTVQQKATIPARRPTIIAIGASTGGPAVIAAIIERLPADLNIPVVIALHLAEGFTRPFAETLTKRGSVPVVEAIDGQTLLPGTVYLAPGGRQMSLVSSPGDSIVRIRISDEIPENDCRPSVDILFRSVAELFTNRAVAVILTGMGRDGTIGLKLLKDRGAFIMAQDEESSIVFGMPAAAIEAGVVDVIGTPADLAARLVALIKRPK